MIIEVKNKDTYIPEWNGNKKLPEAEQIKVNYKFLPPGEKRKYIYTKDMHIDKITGNLSTDVDYVQDLEGLSKAMITGIENYSIKIDGKEYKIDTIDKLYSTAGVSQVLVSEIQSAMLLSSPEVDADFL